ncbi:MAG: sigma-70 family RNA polymerase sigma factor [Candidatus Pacebacteria bacterium]|nr:sigma-70 family RNA polymerase sigma factor [Candidatus Paceibacterota bacterium]
MSLPKEKTLENLVISSVKGDERAFRFLYERLNDPLFKYILSRTKDRDDATDILQDVFVDLWRALDTFTYTSDGQFYGFVFTITKRKLGKHYKNKKVFREIDENLLENSYKMDVEFADDARILMKAIEELKEKYRTVIKLRYWSGLTFPEMGKLLGDKETTVKVRHHRALKLLEDILKTYEQ